MIKGCSKRMIVLKNTGSKLFDEAYFVVKPGCAVGKLTGEKAFIDEANRILNESLYQKPLAQKPENSRKTSFFSGVLCGFLFGFVCAAVVLIAL